jgi:hypothetical protein
MAEKEKPKEATKFAGIMSLISIIGFANIITQSLFEISITPYFNSVLLFLIGIGFMMAARPKNLYEGSKRYFTETSVARLTTFVIGLLSIAASVLTLPEVSLVHPALETIKSIISVIAILFIVFQTWVLER